MTFTETPVLSHRLASVVPLGHEHRDALAEAVAFGELWRTWYTRIPAPDQVAAMIDDRLEQRRQGRMAPWAILDADGRAVGVTSYCNLEPEHRRLEIGHTWLGAQAHATGINPAVKLLLLGRAFEDLGCMRVELRTHWHNHASRSAIERLGAKQEAVLRKHALMPDGIVRDTVVFAIVDDEWQAVRAGLEHRLARREREAQQA